jgi:porphobilinogen synthase
MRFPEYRLRRLRRNENVRRLIRETKLSVDDLIYPLFIVPGTGVNVEIPSLPGQHHLSVDALGDVVREVEALRIPAVLLFGIPGTKDAAGSEAYADDGIIQVAVKEIKRLSTEITVITDVCLCEYTDHGHCGWIEDGEIDNDATLELLAKTAVSHARAGADIVAPSDMMDGRVGSMRSALDQEGFCEIAILAYAAKYSSTFYGPFRDAVESAPQFGDRKSHQMDPCNWREALREVQLDIEEGADIIMVKPALPYLDVISKVRDVCDLPVAAYQVSGEYAMVKAAERMGWVDGKGVMLEALIGIKRAGADMIITYAAREIAKIIG